MTPWVTRLIIANVFVYFVEMTMPRLIEPLVFVPALALLRPWSIVTYMFVHSPSSIMHILFNMIGLYFFGPRVEARLGGARFAQLYFVSGISGALLSLILAPSAAILGASAAVFGVMLAFAWYWPHERIYIWGIVPVPSRVLVLITTAFSLYSGLTGSTGGVADFAHLGGYAGAYLFLKWMERASGAAKFKRAVQAAPREAERAIANWKKVDPSTAHEVNRDELNRILDKINATGLESLTAQERTFLMHFVPPDDRRPIS